MTKNKDKKGKESTIGKIIYGFLLFMPLFAIGVTCLITTFNMSSKQESEIHYKYETNEVDTINDIVVENIYKLNVKNIQYQNDNSLITWATDVFINSTSILIDVEKVNTYALRIVITESTIQVGLYNNTTYIKNILTDTKDNINNFYFVYLRDYNSTYLDYIEISDYNVFDYVETHNINPQDVFYNSIDKVEQSNLFNWAKNSIVYTTLVATCNALSITNTFIPMLLAYWLIISVIYILYDIALMMIIIFHHKVHCLQDSI